MFKKLSPVLFIVLVNTVFTRSSGSVPVYDVSGKKSLYPPDGKVAVLDADDMQTAFNSDKGNRIYEDKIISMLWVHTFSPVTASLVVFYADWCHWSKELVPVYEKLANETYGVVISKFFGHCYPYCLKAVSSVCFLFRYASNVRSGFI